MLGVSPDPVESHAAFRDKFQLNFPLLADVDHQVAEAYGAWREMRIQRSTFLLDRDGNVAQVWQRVQVDGHDEEVLAAVRALG